MILEEDTYCDNLIDWFLDKLMEDFLEGVIHWTPYQQVTMNLYRYTCRVPKTKQKRN